MFTQPFVQVQMKENIKALRPWPLWGNSLVSGEFPAQRTCDAENVSISWCHHDYEPGISWALWWHHYTRPRPTGPHALAWGSTCFHTKIFQLECHRLKIDKKNYPFLIKLHLPIPYLLCKFHIILPKVHMGNLDFFVCRWQMPPGLLCFGHVDWTAKC